MKNLKSKFILFLILALFWILWNNTTEVKVWLYGLVPILLVIMLFGRSAHIFEGARLTPKGIVYSFVYIVVFTWALIKSNIDVALRIINPRLPIRPGIVRVRTSLKSPMARMILANSITLTPGTFVVDIKDDTLYIHWIDVKDEDDAQKLSENISAQFENLLLKIYE